MCSCLFSGVYIFHSDQDIDKHFNCDITYNDPSISCFRSPGECRYCMIKEDIHIYRVCSDIWPYSQWLYRHLTIFPVVESTFDHIHRGCIDIWPYSKWLYRHLTIFTEVVSTFDHIHSGCIDIWPYSQWLYRHLTIFTEVVSTFDHIQRLWKEFDVLDGLMV